MNKFALSQVRHTKRHVGGKPHQRRCRHGLNGEQTTELITSHLYLRFTINSRPKFIQLPVHVRSLTLSLSPARGGSRIFWKGAQLLTMLNGRATHFHGRSNLRAPKMLKMKIYVGSVQILAHQMSKNISWCKEKSVCGGSTACVKTYTACHPNV